MAGGLSVAKESVADYGGRVTSFVVLSCMMAAMGGVLFGYDIGISGGVTAMDAFLRRFFPDIYRRMKGDTKISNYCKFDSQLLTLFTSSLYIAGLITSFSASFVTKIYGRKLCVLLSGAIFLAGSALGGAAQDIYMLILGRVLLGFGVGFANQSVPLYLSEMAPARYRGAFSNGFQLSLQIGGLTANLINYGTEKIRGGWGWRISLSMAAVPALILTLGAIFLPDTPSSLIQGTGKDTNRNERAKSILRRVRGTDDVEAEFYDLVSASSVVETTTNPFCEITKRKYRPQLVMAVAIPLFQQMTGINVIGFYCPVLFRTIGLGESASLLSTIFVSGVVGTVSTFASMLMVDKLGRRTLFLVGGIQMFLSQVMIGAILAAKLGDHGGLSKGYAYLTLLMICVYMAGFGWSWGPLGWLVPSEIYPLDIRSAGQSITVGVSFVFTIAVAQTTLAMLCNLKAGIFFFYGGWVVGMTVFVHLLMPETKNVPIEKMDRVWKEHWLWKRIVGGAKAEEQ
ncbi:hypothetical protein MLD38_002831 [Melastoma candidum]|uniref:Uncharacterized protein n=1 Tax=Melastoma candidum TaxID=119954 RepID=A0ACB9S0M2_9MYRT|nr:hypothetical protein MLD38_002831 [Melastoma candidum]